MIHIDDHITFRDAVLEVCPPSWYSYVYRLLVEELGTEYGILHAVSKGEPLDFEGVIEVSLPQIDSYFYFSDF